MSFGSAVVLLDPDAGLCLFIVLLNGSDVCFFDQAHHSLVYFLQQSIKFEDPGEHVLRHGDAFGGSHGCREWNLSDFMVIWGSILRLFSAPMFTFVQACS